MTENKCAKKRIFWIAVPALLLPYLTLLTLATIFLSTTVPFFKWVMEVVFCSNALYLIAAFLICCFVVAVFSVVCFFVSIYKKWDCVSLAKLFMIVKLIQIPAYVLIFVLGVFMAITVFTIPFSIALFLFDCFSLALTGIGVVSAAINAIRQGVSTPKELFWLAIAQFFFCVDVVASIVLYVKLKKLKKAKTSVN